MKLLVITGLSGAGKSQALNVAEDLGYYCVDNMPPSLVPKFLEIAQEAKLQQVAIVIDIRSRRFFSDLAAAKESIQKVEEVLTIYLEAEDSVLIQRYKALRRPHPLAATIQEGVTEERVLMEDMRQQADEIIDTSDLNNYGLKMRLRNILGRVKGKLNVAVMSFGYKYGILSEADVVFDARLVPNPYYLPELKELNGREEKTKNFIFSHTQAHTFVKKVVEFIEGFSEDYLREGKDSLVVGIGCTGGFHRSVAIAEAVAEELEYQGFPVLVNHRDMMHHEG